jgi:type VII secretion-associated serine protease mycosin
MNWNQAFTAFALIGLLAAQGCGNKGVMTAPTAQAAPIYAAPTGNKNAPRFVNRLVVKFKSGSSASTIRSFQQRFALSAVREVSALGVGVMGLPAGKDASSVIKSIQGHPSIEYVEPDYIFTVPKRAVKTAAAAKTAAKTAARKVAAVGAFNDALIDRQWGLTKIGMPRTWQHNTGAAQVVVAVIDTGVDTRHPDLAANLVQGASVLPGATGPDDDHGHGTHVAGVIAALGHNGVGIAGVAPRCKIMPVKVLNREGKGDTGDIVAGLLYAVNHGAKVVNMSLGGTGGSRALKDAIEYALSKDVVVVAAMGNEGANAQEYPAGYPGVIAVGATDSSDEIASFSNFGSWISVAAPGEDILSTLPTRDVYVTATEGKDNSYDVMDGTSMAAPFVAGLAALIRSQYPTMPAAAVKARIERSADDLGDPGFDEQFGHGRINAARAILGQ